MATSPPASSRPAPLEPPFLSLIASGGHTFLARVTDHGPGYEVLGQTLDDAAGEAFDKGARLLGLGYPGGAALERLARDGDPEAFAFPTGARMPGLDFSFAGLKTALLYRVRELGETESERRRADLAASYQRAIVESLALRVERALAQTGAEQLAIGGGVAANGPLRDRLGRLGVRIDIPPRELCTDNAAMIASAARYVPARPFPEYLDARRVRHRRTGAHRMSAAEVVLYGRDGCCLCDDARVILERVRAAHPFALTEVDIDGDERLLRAYLERIPVVTIDGHEAFELFVDERELTRRLTRGEDRLE